MVIDWAEVVDDPISPKYCCEMILLRSTWAR